MFSCAFACLFKILFILMLFVLSEIKKKEKEKQKAVGQEGACSLPIYAHVLDLQGSVHISAKPLTPGGFTQYFHYFISYNP